MTTPPELVENDIETLSRAIFALLAPITGSRAVGSVLVTAGAAELTIPRNTYLLPVVTGQLRDDLVFKTAGGPWIIAAGETEAVPLVSNLGGARHNVPAGTVFRFDPPLPGVATNEAPAAGDFEDGSDEGALLRSAAIFEDVEEAGPAKDLFAAKVGESPAAVLAWINSEPVDGTTAGLGTRSGRAGRGKKHYHENFALYVRAGHLGGDHQRRREGVVLAQAISRLLTDRMQNDDGEQIATIGAGIEVLGRSKLGRSQTHYLYGIRLRTTHTIERFDTRTWERWRTSRIEGGLGPEDDTLGIVDDTVDMP